MHEYDTALKLLLEGSAVMTLAELSGATVHRWLNVELPEVRSTRVDLLGETTAGELVHIELQSTNDGSMPLRMAEYCLRVYRLFERFPTQILLYVGEDPVRMQSELIGRDQWFRYRLMDIRELDGERLLESEHVGDNIIAILARWQDSHKAVRLIVEKVAKLEPGERQGALEQLLILAGLRKLGLVVEEEASKVPILNDILDHEVLGREYKRGLQEGVQQGAAEGAHQEALAVLRRLIVKRFRAIPEWVEPQLASRPASELEDLILRVSDADSLEELLR
jgi:hypothetical protein